MNGIWNRPISTGNDMRTDDTLKKRKIELLAPAGSFDVFKAVIAAGADAVYMGLPRFSARAYAENAAKENYVDAIRYAHLHGKKLYCTINTLLKENELFDELYDTVKPLYEAGLDAVIVQDLGEMKFLQTHFPDLPIHASTQATSVGPGCAEYLKSLGVKRIVPARELNLSEIRKLYDETGLELECFIHGALCYSYSGQCLFSSIAGGRSGNRGRCAQPCRMNYSVKDADGKPVSRASESCLISLKDLNTLRILPKIIAAGVTSFKIEGRMKKAEYAAGVTSIYRKYIDLYLAGEDPTPTAEDEQHLFDLFNRQGFTEGYYEHENGRDMLTLLDPAYREHDDDFIASVRKRFIENEHKAMIRGTYAFSLGQLYALTIETELDGETYFVTSGSDAPIAQAAEKRSATKEDVEKQLLKAGDTGFQWESLDGTVEDGLFLPVSELNAFRRRMLVKLEEEIHAHFTRECEMGGNIKDDPMGEDSRIIPELKDQTGSLEQKKTDPSGPVFAVTVRTKEQLEAVLAFGNPIRIDLESVAAEADEYAGIVKRAHSLGDEIYLRFPQVFRHLSSTWFELHKEEIRTAGFDGFLVRDLEELDFVRKNRLQGTVVSDHNLYAFNSLAADTLLTFGIDRITAPLELNGHEISSAGLLSKNAELFVYGRAPMMVTANCLHRTLRHCERKTEIWTLTDRMGNDLPVVNDCRFCMNTIYNALPTNLLPEADRIRKMGARILRLEMTTESGKETSAVLKAFYHAFMTGNPAENERTERNAAGSDVLSQKTTRGHFKRGVE